MAFVDEIKIEAKAGKGGDGVVRWRREKFVDKGGPWGGNGGDGGDVIIRCVRDRNILARYRQHPTFAGERGEDGGINEREGKRGDNCYIDVPVGSIITKEVKGSTSKEILRMDNEGEEILVLHGGRGGKGNTHFKSSTNTTPRESTPGTLGEQASFYIEVELIADIGLAGLPNAGKSSLLNALTSAHAKVGNFAFTTLEPNLGVLPSGHVIADIPGLIEGAAEGRGLGHRFLKHIRRTRLVVHIISAEEEDVVQSYNIVHDELQKYDPELIQKNELVFVTKADTVTHEVLQEKIDQLQKLLPRSHIVPVSIIDDDLLHQAKRALEQTLNELDSSASIENNE